MASLNIKESQGNSITFNLPELLDATFTIPTNPKFGDPVTATMPDGTQTTVTFYSDWVKLTTTDSSGLTTTLKAGFFVTLAGGSGSDTGNVSAGLLRRRARGFRDTEYFKLKICQLNTPDRSSFLYADVPQETSLPGKSTV